MKIPLPISPAIRPAIDTAIGRAIGFAGGGIGKLADPVISGNPFPGMTLSCTTGLWDGEDLTFTYQWLKNGADIGGATNNTWVVAGVSHGDSIVCAVTCHDGSAETTALSNSLIILMDLAWRGESGNLYFNENNLPYFS